MRSFLFNSKVRDVKEDDKNIENISSQNFEHDMKIQTSIFKTELGKNLNVVLRISN